MREHIKIDHETSPYECIEFIKKLLDDREIDHEKEECFSYVHFSYEKIPPFVKVEREDDTPLSRAIRKNIPL